MSVASWISYIYIYIYNYIYIYHTISYIPYHAASKYVQPPRHSADLCSQRANMKHRFCTRCQLHLQLPSHNAIQIQVSPALREAGWSSPVAISDTWTLKYIEWRMLNIAKRHAVLWLFLEKWLAALASSVLERNDSMRPRSITICSLSCTLKSIEKLDPMYCLL